MFDTSDQEVVTTLQEDIQYIMNAISDWNLFKFASTVRAFYSRLANTNWVPAVGDVSSFGLQSQSRVDCYHAIADEETDAP